MLIPTALTVDFPYFQTLLGGCNVLQTLTFCLFPHTARLLGSIPSNSISLIHLHNPGRLGRAPTTYTNSWPWTTSWEFEHYISSLTEKRLAEFVHLGVTIRKMARRFSDHHPGSKTRVRATLSLSPAEIQAVENGETPLYKMRLEEELRDFVDLELILQQPLW